MHVQAYTHMHILYHVQNKIYLYIHTNMNTNNNNKTLFILGHNRSIKCLSGLDESAHNVINNINIKQQLI